MRKYLLHVLIISFVFLLTPTVQAKTPEEIAIETFKEQVRENHDFAEFHFFLSSVYYESGMYEEAIKSYKQAIRINPDDAKAHYGLGLVYVGIKDRDSALEQYKILKSLDTELANKLFDDINKGVMK